jgi:4'-phosphopantetheinyl transferase EntD
MIEQILPISVVAVETRGDWEDVSLWPTEEASLGNPVEKRRREFLTARACARRALGLLGLPPSPIPAGPHGEPCWPTGVVGSITHCAGYRACGLGHAASVAAIGIDAEPHAALPDGVLQQITLAQERAWVCARARVDPTVHWDRLIFCAKEAVYKTWFPLVKRKLSFEDALIAIQPTPQTFRATLLAPGPEMEGGRLPTLRGRWLVCDGLVLTAIAVTRRSQPS